MAFGALKGTLTGNATSISTSAPLTGSVAVVVGDLVYAVFGEQTAPTTTTVSDNLGNTYAATQVATDAGTSTGHAYWARVTVAGTLTTITAVASGGSSNFAGFAAVIEGPFHTSPLDANPTNITTDITSPFTCPPTGTLAQASEVVMAWGVATGSTVWAATSPNLLAGQAATATILHTVIGYQAVAATTTVSPAFTAASNPSDCVLGTTSFKAAPASQTLTPDLFDDSTDTFFGATVGRGPVALTAGLYADADVFQTATVTMVLAAPLVNEHSELIQNPGFDSDTVWTKGTGWTIAAGLASKSATGSLSNLSQVIPLVVDKAYEITFTVSGRTAGSVSPRFFVGTVVAGTARSTNGTFTDTLTAVAGNASFAMNGSTTFGGSVDDVSVKESAFFLPSVAQILSLSPSLFDDTADSFYTAAVAVGAVALAPSLLADGDSFPAATVAPGAVSLAPDLFADADTFHAATVSSAGSQLSPSLYSDADTFYSTTVSAGAVSLAPSLYSDADGFFAATVSVGGVTLTPALFADADTFHSAFVSSGGAVLQPALFADADAFFAATVSRGAVTLTAALFADADTFPAATVSRGGVAVQPSLFVDGDTFYASTVATGANNLAPTLFSDADAFFLATVSRGAVSLAPELFDDGDAFYSAGVSTIVALTAALYGDADVFHVPTVGATSGQTLHPGLFVDADTFYQAARSGGSTPVSAGVIQLSGRKGAIALSGRRSASANLNGRKAMIILRGEADAPTTMIGRKATIVLHGEAA